MVVVVIVVIVVVVVVVVAAAAAVAVDELFGIFFLTGEHLTTLFCSWHTRMSTRRLMAQYIYYVAEVHDPTLCGLAASVMTASTPPSCSQRCTWYGTRCEYGVQSTCTQLGHGFKERGVGVKPS